MWAYLKLSTFVVKGRHLTVIAVHAVSLATSLHLASEKSKPLSVYFILIQSSSSTPRAHIKIVNPSEMTTRTSKAPR